VNLDRWLDFCAQPVVCMSVVWVLPDRFAGPSMVHRWLTQVPDGSWWVVNDPMRHHKRTC